MKIYYICAAIFLITAYTISDIYGSKRVDLRITPLETKAQFMRISS